MKKLIVIAGVALVILLTGCTRTSLIIIDGNRGITGAIKGKIVKITDWSTQKDNVGYKSKYTVELVEGEVKVTRESEPIK